MSNNYFIFDKNKCVACEACVVACILENGYQFPNNWRTVFNSNPLRIPEIPIFNLSLSCNHCNDAPCMYNCPSLAYSRDPITNAIIINSNLCIGCRYCTWNCPYVAPKYNPIKSIIEKCNFCNIRLKDKLAPACSIGCPTGALDFSFEKIDKSKSNKYIPVPVNTEPSMKVIESYKQHSPIIDNLLFKYDENDQDLSNKTTTVSAKKEWPLLVFTYIISILIAISATNILSSQSQDIKVIFLAIGGISAGISIIHLGLKQKFWRSFLNIKKSWLSREIFFFTLYYILSIIDLLIYDLPTSFIVLCGLLTILSIDLLYKPLQWKWKSQWHSGQAIFIAVSIFLYLTGLYYLLLLLFAIRIIIIYINNQHKNNKFQYMAIRFLLPLLATLLLYLNYLHWLSFCLFLAGELIDRIYFYNDLEIFTIDTTTTN